MEKLDIHEFLRIYIPGLFLAFVGGRMLYGADIENSVVVTTAIFLGLAFSWFATALSQRLFGRLAEGRHFGSHGARSDFWNAWHNVAQRDAARPEKPDELREHVKSVAFSHYASRYGSPELYGFRLPKTFGVLYFNVAAAAATLALVPASHLATGWPGGYHPLVASPVRDAVLLALTAVVFAWISRAYFIGSLRMELMYWRGLDQNRDQSRLSS